MKDKFIALLLMIVFAAIITTLTIPRPQGQSSAVALKGLFNTASTATTRLLGGKPNG